MKLCPHCESERVIVISLPRALCLLGILSIGLGGCSQSSGGGTHTGGMTGPAGSSGGAASGGTSGGSGGASGTGGAAALGGTTGAGGTVAAGGTKGMGGFQGTGDTTTVGLGGSGSGGGGGSTVQYDAFVQPEAFELDGSWLYLGPSDGPHTLKIGNGSMAYADINGTWSSNWTTKDYDNGLHHFQVVFESGTGTYLPVGQTMSGTYDLNGSILTVQLASGLASYSPVQSPGSCTEGSTLIPDCRIYVKQ